MIYDRIFTKRQVYDKSVQVKTKCCFDVRHILLFSLEFLYAIIYGEVNKKLESLPCIII